MQMIAAIEIRPQVIRVCGIAHYLVKIDDSIKVTGSSNPLIHGLAVRFIRRARMVVIGTHVGQNSGTDRRYSMRVGASDYLLISAADALHQRGMLGGTDLVCPSEPAEVVDALQHDQVLNTGLRQHVPIETCKSIRAESIGEEVVAADALVKNTDIS